MESTITACTLDSLREVNKLHINSSQTNKIGFIKLAITSQLHNIVFWFVIPLIENHKKTIDMLAEKTIAIHIPKTAGSSVNKLFENTYGAVNCACHIEQYRTKPDVQSIYKDLLTNKKFLSGHLSYWAFKLYFPIDDQNISIITFLRDPLFQLVSHIKWIKAAYARPQFRKQKNKSLLEFSEQLSNIDLLDTDKLCNFLLEENDTSYNLLRNKQTRYLCPEQPPLHLKREHAESALGTLDKLSFVGITEYFEESTKALCQKFDIPVKYDNEEENRTPIKEDIDTNHPRMNKILRSYIGLDELIYDKALDIFNR